MLEQLKQKMMARRAARKNTRERGSLIIDAMIGIAIAAMIYMNASSGFAKWQAAAHESNAVENVTSIGVTLQSNYIDTQTYPAASALTGAAASTWLAAEQVVLGTGQSIAKYSTTAVAGQPKAFNVCVEHVEGAAAVYASAKSAVIGKVRSGGCAAAATKAGVTFA